MVMTYEDFTAASPSDNYAGMAAASSDLAASIRSVFETMRQHRDTSGVSDRLLYCLRAYNGEYSPRQLSEIRQFGGSETYARVTAVKCRTAAALLTDLYLGAERPWGVEPTPEPTLPSDISGAIQSLVHAEANESGVTDPEAVRSRMSMVYEQAMIAAREQAGRMAKRAEVRLEDELVEGGFYTALRDLIDNFTIFPYAALKGPFFRMSRRVIYEDGIPTVQERPVKSFSAPSPFDLWFSPGVADVDDGDVVERLRLSRFDLEALRAAPHYDAEAIDAVIAEMPGGYSEDTSSVEQARADEEERESPTLNDSGLYDVLEFHGWIAGASLVDEPLFAESEIDPERSHHCTVRLVNRMVISAHLNPDPMERAIYHVESFESVPGSIVGRGLPEILVDVQATANTALRALNNNMGLASGPQVGINTAAMDPNTNPKEMYPWKRWFYMSDPAAPTAPPFMFFQPTDNSHSLMTVYERVMTYADEVSAIPRYASGGEKVGGAGRTASGLAMLQGNVAKVIRHTAGAIDSILASVLRILYDLTLLTDTDGLFRGDEQIRPRGVAAAAKQEMERMRALEFMQLTGNEIDMQILGLPGRAAVLAQVAEHLGFDHGALAEQMRRQIAAASNEIPAENGTGSSQTPGPGPDPRVNEGVDNAQRTRTPRAIGA